MSTAVASLPSQATSACGPDCCFAEALRGVDPDWLWCRRPETLSCVARVDHECRHFCPRRGSTDSEAARHDI